MLFAFHPSATRQFVRHKAAAHLTPPTVGALRSATEPAVALAGTLAAWLESYGHPVTLAPPLLRAGGSWRVADLGLDRPLPPYAD